MRRRLLAVLASAVVCLGSGLVVAPPVQAYTYTVLDMCSSDPDGKLCVVSATRNGVPVTSDYPSTPGTHEWFYVDNGWRDGVFSFNLNTITVPESGPPTASKSVDASATWAITVNTGSYYPRELNSKTRNTTFTRGGSPTTGYWFRIQFNPVPIAWRWTDETGPYGCDMTACGTDSTVAEFATTAGQGVSDGYVTDLADSSSPAYVGARSGFVLASNAQYQGEPYYDSATNSLIVEMANPHLSAPGVQAKGFFEAFLPNSYLTSQLGVPYPETLTGGTFTVFRVGASSSTPFTLTRTSTGIWIKVHDIGFSRPQYRLSAKPSPPGTPRSVAARKISTHKARVRFVRPVANGGRKIDLYQARCHKLGKAWHRAKGTSSPITVGDLPRGRVFCQVRAHNRLGYGRWSATDRT